MHRTPRARSLLALGAVVALLLVGCSSSGGDEAATTTEAETSTTASDETTTTVDGDESTTTEATDPGDGPTSADLEAILPTAGDLGDGWTAAPSDDDGDDEDTTIADQCPDAAALADEDDDDSDHVEASFEKEDGQEVSVELNPSAKEISADDLETYAQALNDCTAETTDDDTGITTTLTFEVTPTDSYGDQGVQIEGTATLSGGQLPDSIELKLYSLAYRHGTVGVQVQGQDGLDETALEPIAFDPDQLIALADLVDPQIGELVD